MPISETAIISWLEPLIAMDTRNGTGDEVACVKWLAAVLKAHNPDQLTVQTVARSRGKSDSAYVLAVWGHPQILLNVHIDTVPSGEGWTQDPHLLRQEGDHYIGLGTSDIKGAAACILAALEVTRPKDVAILFSGDEEHGSEVMPVAIADNQLGNIPHAIVCEPTSCTMGARHRGMLAMRVGFSGPGGHSSLSDVTPAPLQKITRYASAMSDYGDRFKDVGEAVYKGVCLNIGEITGDGAYNVIPTQAAMKFSMRPPPGDTVARHETAAREILAKLYPDASLEIIAALNPFKSKAPERLSRICLGLSPIDLPYWTEAAMLSEVGVNAVVFGPGNVDQAHKPNEYVEVSQLITAANVYSGALSGESL
ncbi:MAG: M20/M25/M40 family metallo-hydrolase [Maricaulaceae bacterium]